MELSIFAPSIALLTKNRNMNNKEKIVIVGSANTDMVISADHFPLPGETLMGTNFMTNYGGKGANQAVAAARMGGQTVFIGKVGDDDFGTSTISNLSSEGIDISHLYTTQEVSTGVALITTIPSGENSIIVSAGANGRLTAEDVRKSEDTIAQACTVLMQLETPLPPSLKLHGWEKSTEPTPFSTRHRHLPLPCPKSYWRILTCSFPTRPKPAASPASR